MKDVRIPFESGLLLFAASILVPRPLRADWRKEWDGEVWWWIASQPDAARSLRERFGLALHCAGAISDGVCLWLQDEDRLDRLRAAVRGPRACLSGGVLLIAVIGILSGGFQNTRRSLQATLSPQSRQLAILSQAGPFMGQQFGVPPLKVAYWGGHSKSLQGVAAYSWYRSVAGRDAEHTSDVLAAKVGPQFFSLLRTKAQLGRVFGADEAESCRSCAFVGYEFW